MKPGILKYCIKNISVKHALKAMDESENKTLFVVDDNEVLIGALTDGDIRRWILKSEDLSESIYKIMNPLPVFLYEHEKHTAFEIMKKKQIYAIPVVNDINQVTDVLFLHNFLGGERSVEKSFLDATVIINAGGEGARLNPVTLVIPKPLVPIGGVSILERIIDKFTGYYVWDFTVIINYKKELIKAYFSELKSNYKIKFIEESEPLGTVGGLSRMEGIPYGKSIFFSNCDILIEADYNNILKFHKENRNKITIVASVKNTRLQYGVVDVDKLGNVSKIREKPEYDFLANTGFYVLEPEILKYIPKNQFYHATDLINKCIEKEEKVGIYPIGGDCWMDMGQFSEMGIMLEKLSYTK